MLAHVIVAIAYELGSIEPAYVWSQRRRYPAAFLANLGSDAYGLYVKYQVHISHETISAVADAVLDEIIIWQTGSKTSSIRKPSWMRYGLESAMVDP